MSNVFISGGSCRKILISVNTCTQTNRIKHNVMSVYGCQHGVYDMMPVCVLVVEMWMMAVGKYIYIYWLDVRLISLNEQLVSKHYEAVSRDNGS